MTIGSSNPKDTTRKLTCSTSTKSEFDIGNIEVEAPLVSPFTGSQTVSFPYDISESVQQCSLDSSSETLEATVVFDPALKARFTAQFDKFCSLRRKSVVPCVTKGLRQDIKLVKTALKSGGSLDDIVGRINKRKRTFNVGNGVPLNSAPFRQALTIQNLRLHVLTGGEIFNEKRGDQPELRFYVVKSLSSKTKVTLAGRLGKVVYLATQVRGKSGFTKSRYDLTAKTRLPGW